MFHPSRRIARSLILLIVLTTLTGLGTAGATAQIQTHLTGGCITPTWFYNDEYYVLTHSGAQQPPSYFWTQRDYLAKIADYESCFQVGVYNGSCCYGLFQLDASNIGSTLWWQTNYWSKYFHGGYHGTTWWPAADWEILAGDRYIWSRYGSPYAAWQHELAYGWY